PNQGEGAASGFFQVSRTNDAIRGRGQRVVVGAGVDRGFPRTDAARDGHAELRRTVAKGDLVPGEELLRDKNRIVPVDRVVDVPRRAADSGPGQLFGRNVEVHDAGHAGIDGGAGAV